MNRYAVKFDATTKLSVAIMTLPDNMAFSQLAGSYNDSFAGYEEVTDAGHPAGFKKNPDDSVTAYDQLGWDLERLTTNDNNRKLRKKDYPYWGDQLDALWKWYISVRDSTATDQNTIDVESDIQTVKNNHPIT